MDVQELIAYRQLGLRRLEQLLLQLPEQPDEVDVFVDGAIRTLSQLPDRPGDALPYVGLYGPAPLETHRSKSASRLYELMIVLSEPSPIDGHVDRYIRVLSKLPDRPEEADPYVRLFTLPTVQALQQLVHADTFDASGVPQLVTAEQLIQIAGSSDLDDRLREFTPGVNATFAKFQINTPLRMAHFLAQVMHESGCFRYMREIWGPTDWQIGYEGREDLGNLQPGDGDRFMGRGLIQLTGRANYQEFSDAMGIDFTANPELVEQSPYAVMAAGWYWDTRRINEYADADDLIAVTRSINGGTLGIDDRADKLEQAKAVLM